jgi:HlyD family secretion protein
MTANVKLVFAEKPSVLKVANAALRFRPAGSDGGPTGPAAAGGAAQGGPRSGAPGGSAGGGANRMEAIRERLVQTYKLDDAQQHKLDAILQESRSQFAGLQGLPEQERQARVQKNREATRLKIREILTPDQRTRYDTDAAAGAGSAGRSGRTTAGRVWIQAPDGKLQPVTVTLGISDGTSTEVASGDLKEGQEVVTGAAGAQGARPGGSAVPTAPRLRL